MDDAHKVNLYYGALRQILIIIKEDNVEIPRAVLRAKIDSYIHGILGDIPKKEG